MTLRDEMARGDGFMLTCEQDGRGAGRRDLQRLRSFHLLLEKNRQDRLDKGKEKKVKEAKRK